MTYKLHCPDGKVIKLSQQEIDDTIFALAELSRKTDEMLNGKTDAISERIYDTWNKLFPLLS